MIVSCDISEDLYTSTHLCVITRLCGGLIMKRLTISIPEELKAKLDKLPEVNWPEVLKTGIIRKLEQLEKFEELVSKGVI